MYISKATIYKKQIKIYSDKEIIVLSIIVLKNEIVWIKNTK